MKSDPEKQRAWRERGARKYAEKQRTKPIARSKPRARAQNRKPRRNDAPWRREVEALRGRYCRRCRSTRHLQCDHVKPRSQGGPSVVENGTMLCEDCHRGKTEGRIQYERSWLDPDQIAWLADVGWVWWNDDGEPCGRGWKHFAPVLVHNGGSPTDPGGRTMEKGGSPHGDRS